MVGEGKKGYEKFKKKNLQNEDLLRQMFCDIANDGEDHWNHMGASPLVPTSANNDTENGGTQEREGDGRDEVAMDSPSTGSDKRRARLFLEKGKKLKSSTTLVIQE